MNVLYKKIKDKNVLLLLLILIIAVSAIFVSFTYSYGLFHYDLRDYYEGLFWAQASLKANSIINKEYMYSYLVPFGSNIIMAPFVKLFGLTFLSNGLGMVVFFIIYLLTTFKLSKSLYKETRHRLLFMICVSLFVFTYIGDNLLHHILGYGIAFVSFLGMTSCVIEIKNKNKLLLNYILLVIYGLWSSANGVLSIALSNIAIIFGLFVVDLLRIYKKQMTIKDIDYKLYLTIILVTVLGFIAYYLVNSNANTLNKQSDRFVFDNIYNIVMNIKIVLLTDYFKAFFIDPEGISFFSSRGIFTLLKFFFSAVVIGFPTYYLFKNRKNIKQIHENIDFIFISNLFVSFVCLFQYLFSTQTVVRFLFNALLSLFTIMAICFVDLDKKRTPFSRGGVIVLTIIVITFSLKGIFQTYPNGKENMKKIENVVNVLNERNLTFGYTCTDVYNKQINIFTNEDIFTSTLLFDKDEEKFYVERELSYDFELEKPKDVDTFFVLADSYTDYCLSDNCIEKVDLNDESLSLYIFDMSSFDKIITMNHIEKED